MSRSLSELTEDSLRSYFSLYPTTASHLGWPGHDQELPDLSDDRIDATLKEWDSVLTELETLTPEDKESRIDADLLARLIKRNRFALQVQQHHKLNPADSVETVADSLWELMMGGHRTEPEKLEAITKRLEIIPGFLKRARHNHKRPVELWTSLAIEEIPGTIQYLTDTILPYLDSHHVASASQLIESACHSLDEFAVELKQQTNWEQTFAIGKENFESLLHDFHGIEHHATDIQETGLKQIELITKQLKAHANEMDPAQSWQELVTKLKGNHPAEAELMTAYRNKVAETKSFLHEQEIVSLPEQESLRIIETPLFLQNMIPYAAYSEPTMFADDDRGTFYVTPVNGNQELLQDHCNASFPLTALHEAYPGHHLQFSIQRTLPSPIRRVYNVASYYEGWTLYCEEMMHRAGFYDDAMRLYQLKDRLWRAARIVVDVGMQCFQMTDREAAAFLSDKAKLSPQGARVDVNWYTQSPTIPMSYLIGMLEVDRMRESYQAKGHSLKEFHDAFLSSGAIPLNAVRQLLLE